MAQLKKLEVNCLHTLQNSMPNFLNLKDFSIDKTLWNQILLAYCPG